VYLPTSVIPAKAGNRLQLYSERDSGVRWNDALAADTNLFSNCNYMFTSGVWFGVPN
jgi:hypothetical protein